ncbi:MAG: hypothetical protein EA398_14175, partial [Deltaproteobacteria bacterium]
MTTTLDEIALRSPEPVQTLRDAALQGRVRRPDGTPLRPDDPVTPHEPLLLDQTPLPDDLPARIA